MDFIRRELSPCRTFCVAAFLGLTPVSCRMVGMPTLASLQECWVRLDEKKEIWMMMMMMIDMVILHIILQRSQLFHPRFLAQDNSCTRHFISEAPAHRQSRPCHFCIWPKMAICVAKLMRNHGDVGVPYSQTNPYSKVHMTQDANRSDLDLGSLSSCIGAYPCG